MTNEKSTTGDELLGRDERFVLRPWSGSDEPVPIVEAKGCTITDAFGKQLLDFTSGYFVNQAGHCHPDVARAASEQMTKVMQVSGRHTTPAQVNLAERLVQLAPKSLDKVFFSTGGSEANEFAVKMVRQKTGKTKLACLDNGYHGLSLGVLGACAAEKYRDTAGVELGDHYTTLPTPYCYRCPHQNDCALQCLEGVPDTLDKDPEIGALIAEPIQAVGGIIPPKKWWERMTEILNERGLLLLLDEIQTGAGRTGAMFAAEHYNLEPEILTGGKGLSGGVGSLAVTLVQNAVSEGFFGGTTPTSGGNAVSCAAGFALLEVLEREKLVENAAEMGEYFTDAVWALDDPWVGDVRFKGLLGGVELVSDRESKAILDKELVGKVKDELFTRDMLITTTGPHGNCLRLQPSLCISSSELDAFVTELKLSLEAVRSRA